MIGMLLLNIIYNVFNNNYYDIYDFIFGNSIVITIILFISSIVFDFCNWHKAVIINNYILSLIYNHQTNYKLLNVIYYIDIVITIFIIIGLIKHINNKNYGHKTKNNKINITRMY